MPKSAYTQPRKGTKIRLLVNRLIAGTTVEEVAAALKWPKPLIHHMFFTSIRDDYGLDVRSFSTNLPGKSRIYKIVGRWEWDGRYRSFIQPNKKVLNDE